MWSSNVLHDPAPDPPPNNNPTQLLPHPSHVVTGAGQDLGQKHGGGVSKKQVRKCLTTMEDILDET